MTAPALEQLTGSVADLAAEARSTVILPKLEACNWQRKDKDGEGRNFVTDIDLETEAFLVKGLEQLLPGAGMIAEESKGAEQPDGFEWVVDPIDGTTNLMHGLPPYCISIALLEHRKPVVGVILEIHANELFTAWRGGGAYLNGRAIHVSSTPQIADALLCTGFPYDQSDTAYFDQWIQLYSALARSSHGVRRLGAAAVDLAYVAAGRLDGFYEYNLEPWDVAAGVVLIQEAGGIISDFQGEDEVLFKKELVASNGKLHGELLNRIQAFIH
jgi:myo-inositol-1(or 4)-monophosphatase